MINQDIMASLKIIEKPLVEMPTRSNPNVPAEDDGAPVRIPASALPGAKVDVSLTQPGKAAAAARVAGAAAEAKAVGDAIAAEVKAAITYVDTAIQSAIQTTWEASCR